MQLETDSRKVLAELDKILGSAAFANADRPAKLLRFLVEETLAGRSGIKESVLAVEVLGRRADFDSRIDPIARVEISRLRSRLDLFYASEGRADEVKIRLPKGTYVPVFEAPDAAGFAAPQAPRSRNGRFPKRVWAGTGAAIVTFFLGLWLGSQKTPGPRMERLSVLPPPGAAMLSFSISPDGQTVAMSAAMKGAPRLYLRSLDSFNVRALPGTEFGDYPFWSPDSKSIGFFAQGKLKVIEVESNSVRSVCDAPLGRGGTWNAHGEILFAPGALGALFRVSSQGGKPWRVSTLDAARGEIGHRWPQFLPDGHRYIFFAVAKGPGASTLRMGDLQSNENRLLVESGLQAIPTAHGGRPYLLFQRGEALEVQALDVESASLAGEPTRIADHVRYDPLSRYSGISASASGLVAWDPGSAFDQQLVWVDRGGSELERIPEAGDFICLRISPGGSHAALSRSDPRSGWPGIWNLDLSRGSMYPLGQSMVDWFPVWSPGGESILYSSGASKAEAATALKIAPATGGSPSALRVTEGPAFPSDWSPDGAWVAYTGYSARNGSGVWLAPVNAGELGTPTPFIDSDHNEGGAVFSPVSTHGGPLWLAYTSDESGRDEVYVRSFPSAGTKMKISLGGGSRPLWRHDAGELYFLDPKGLMMAARVRNVKTMEIDRPVELFRIRTPPPARPPYALNYATWDGSRFLIRSSISEDEQQSIAVLTHWAPRDGSAR